MITPNIIASAHLDVSRVRARASIGSCEDSRFVILIFSLARCSRSAEKLAGFSFLRPNDIDTMNVAVK
jgi:hypothetical protein